MILLFSTILLSVVLVMCLSRKSMMWFVCFGITVLVGSLLFKGIKGYMPIPAGVRQLMYLAVSPKDLRDPIVVDDFLFHEKGFSRIYDLKPKYLGFYDCGFFTEDSIKEGDQFKGALRFEFYWKGKKLFEEVVVQAKTYTRNKVSLISFEVPFFGKHIKDISIKITVLEPDLAMEDRKPAKLYVAVTGTP